MVALRGVSHAMGKQTSLMSGPVFHCDFIVFRAQAKLEQKRQERMEREREEEKRKDKEQREIGKNVTKLRQWQKEQEQKEAINEWKKDREENKKYKEKIKQEIARDR